MLKKICAVLTALIIPVMNFVYADALYETHINTEKGITVNTPIVKYVQGKSINVDFEVINTLKKDIELNVSVGIDSYGGERVGGSTLSRKLRSGEAVPVSYGVSDTELTGNISVNIYASELSEENIIYVSEYGDDNNDGTNNKPLRTVSAAVERVRLINQSPDYKDEDVSVVIKSGNYLIHETIAVSEDVTSNLHSLTIMGEDGDSVLHGGVSVKGSDFEKVISETELSMFNSCMKGKIYKLNMKDYGITTSYDDGTNAQNEPIYTLLYYNGKTEQISRYPNNDYETGTVLLSSKKEASVTSTAIKPWENYGEAWIRGWFMWEWDMVKGRIESISQKNSNGERTIVLEQLFAGAFPDDKEIPKTYTDKKWYVYNLPYEIDIEGEYAIKDGILYYYPCEADVLNGDFEKAKILVNTDTGDMFNITADNVTVKGLTFENSGGYFINAGADNFRLIDSEFRNGSKNAVKVKGYNNLVSSCDFHDLGGQGLSLGGGDRTTLTKSDSVVENCYFEKTGQISRTNCSALYLDGCGVTARRNTITDVPHLALSFGGNDHVIEYNDIYNCLTDNAGDAGVIYTGGSLAVMGTVVRKNYIHDSNSGLGGVYWDNWLSGQIVDGNVFENIDRALLIHGGVCNAFKNNIVINALYGAQVRGRARMQAKTITYKNSSGQSITEDVKFNMWDTAPLLRENLGTPYGYNPYGNVFLCTLVGNYHVTNETYPKLPWQGEIWQKAYGNVLKYVNNKTDDLANETELSGNYFVNSHNGIYCYAQMQGMENKLIINKENVVNATALNPEKLAQYNDVVKNSGIYSNEYRTIK